MLLTRTTLFGTTCDVSHTTMAMKMEAAAKAKEAPGRLIPVPRQISAGCGLAWCAPVADRVSLEQLIATEQIVTEGCYELLL